MNALVLVFLAGLTAAAASAEEVELAILKLQDRFNQWALESISGPVKYEFIYSGRTPGGGVILLEDPPRAAVEDTSNAGDASSSSGSSSSDGEEGNASPESGLLSPDGGGDRTTEEYRTVAVDAETTRTEEGETIRLITEQVRVGPVGVVQEPPPGETLPDRDDLPGDLLSADLGQLKQAMRVSETEGEDRYLGVREVRKVPRFPGERLTAASDSLSVMDRRVLRWKVRRLLGEQPPGSLLFLEPVSSEIQGDVARVTVRWSFKSPGPAPDEEVVHSEGEKVLVLRKVQDAWQVTDMENWIETMASSLGGSGSL